MRNDLRKRQKERKIKDPLNERKITFKMLWKLNKETLNKLTKRKGNMAQNNKKMDLENKCSKIIDTRKTERINYVTFKR